MFSGITGVVLDPSTIRQEIFHCSAWRSEIVESENMLEKLRLLSGEDGTNFLAYRFVRTRAN